MQYLVSEFAPFTLDHKKLIEQQPELSFTVFFVNDTMSKEEASLYGNAIQKEVNKTILFKQITNVELLKCTITNEYYVDELLAIKSGVVGGNILKVEEKYGYEYMPFSKHHIFDTISESMAKYCLTNEMFGLTKQIHLVFNSMSYKRFKHTMRVVYRMMELVAIYDHLEPIPAYFAALFHDYAKEQPIDEQQMYVERFFPTFADVNPAVYHGFAAAVELQQMDDTLDGDVYEAIAYHPIGIPEYCQIGLALMIADFCEFGRPFVEEWQTVWKAATSESLELGAYEKIMAISKHFSKTGDNKLYTSTENMLEWLKELLNK